MKRIIYLATCALLSIVGVKAQSVTLHPSRHGVEAGEARKTLVALQLNEVKEGTTLEVDFTLTGNTPSLVTDLELLISDSLVVRDVDDYKGRVPYTIIPIEKGASKVTLPLKRLGRNRTLYLTAHLATPTEYSILNKLTCNINAVSIDGKPLELNQQGADTSRRFFRHYKPLYVPGDNASRNYRIPALLKTSKGTLIAVADRRKFNQTDIPEDVDLVVRRSYDGGATWTEQEAIVQGRGWGAGYGDAALVETESGKIVLLAIGGPGLWHSTATHPQPTYMFTSEDDGVTWSEPQDITHFLYGANCSHPQRSKFLSSFCASGQGLRTTSGRIMFVAAMRVNEEYKLDNYLIYSDDEGATWQVSELAYKGGDESKVIQLPNGDILMSIRNQHHRTDRIFMLSKDNGQTWQSTTRFKGMHDPAVDGAPLFVEWQGKPTLLHSLPIGPKKRWDGAIYVYDEVKDTWSEPILINPGMSAYSDMVLIDNETIGYFVEEDDQMSMVFITFTIADLFQLKEHQH